PLEVLGLAVRFVGGFVLVELEEEEDARVRRVPARLVVEAARLCARGLDQALDRLEDALLLTLPGGPRGCDDVGHGYCVAVRPPSRVRTWPVTNDEASEQKKSAAPTRSSGSAIRPSGIRAISPWWNDSSASRLSTCGVRTKVGEIALTVMPCFAHSVACWRVSAFIAPLAAT